MASRNIPNFADPYLDEGKPVILQCDERNFPHRGSVVSRENLVPLKPKDKGGETIFNELPKARHRRSLDVPVGLLGLGPRRNLFLRFTVGQKDARHQ
jgi:hypothetical protein